MTDKNQLTVFIDQLIFEDVAMTFVFLKRFPWVGLERCDGGTGDCEKSRNPLIHLFFFLAVWGLYLDWLFFFLSFSPPSCFPFIHVQFSVSVVYSDAGVFFFFPLFTFVFNVASGQQAFLFCSVVGWSFSFSTVMFFRGKINYPYIPCKECRGLNNIHPYT